MKKCANCKYVLPDEEQDKCEICAALSSYLAQGDNDFPSTLEITKLKLMSFCTNAIVDALYCICRTIERNKNV